MGAPAPWTRPARTSTLARSCSSRTRVSSMRLAYSSSLRNCRVPNCAGRSNGTPYSPSVVHSPCRSGSPHGVRPRHVVSRFVCALAGRVHHITCADAAITNAPAVIVRILLRVMAIAPLLLLRFFGALHVPDSLEHGQIVLLFMAG